MDVLNKLLKLFNKYDIPKRKYNSIIENLKEVIFFDVLTEAFSRKYFLNLLNKVLHESRRYNHYFSFVYIDLNGFKALNDTKGHLYGDRVLKFFSKLIIKSIREGDIFGRLGGDEFGLLLKHTTKKQAESKLKSLLNKVKGKLSIGFSYGICYVDSKFRGKVDKILKIADNEMYSAKKNSAKS